MDTEAKSVQELLSGNAYPGRGILVGKSADGKYAVFAYFIMGRSNNSRNRVLVREGDSLFTRPFDASKVKDPSLIIYRAARFVPRGVIVTNGDQTDTVYDALSCGKGFADALDTRTYEPDAPNYTPRISALLSFGEGGTYAYGMSILRKADDSPDCIRAYFDYEGKDGLGHLIHTYQTDGNPLPSFCGAPRAVRLPSSLDVLGDSLWASLDEGNKIALYVCAKNVQTGEMEEKIYNKNQA